MSSSSFFHLPCVRVVGSFHELATSPLADGVNALCWPRQLPGDFAEVVAKLGHGEGFVLLDESVLGALDLSAAGRTAVDFMLEDLRRLVEFGLEPELNCIHGYLRDESDGPIATDVFSWHADSATAEADTWLCTYHGASSEGLPIDAVRRLVDLPEVRQELLLRYGGEDDDGFIEYLADHCYDLHYAPLPGAQPYGFGIGHLWRIATDWPGSPVPPCVHRAPATNPGEPSRLLLIS